MKKRYKLLFLLLLVLAVLYGFYHYFLSGKSNYQSIYLVPNNAVLILETDGVYQAWQKIVHSDAWQAVGQIEALDALNQELQAMDSLLRNKSILLRTIDRRNLMASMHEYAPGEYEMLYILNLGRIARMKKPGALLSSMLGADYTITQRDYQGQRIYELLDRESNEMYTFCFVHDKAVVSPNYLLVEAAIDEMAKMRLGRDLDFITIRKRMAGKGLFTIYVNYREFTPYLASFTDELPENLKRLNKELHYSGFSFHINTNGLIEISGYTGVNTEEASYYSSVLQTGSGGLESTEVIPSRVASLAKLSFTNAEDFYRSSLNRLSEAESEEYLESLQRIEKKLKISIEEHVLSWIDDEIVLLHTQPSNLGRDNEFAAILKARNARQAETNLDFICEQIEKNSPIKIKRVNYQGYTISYISFPGILKALFGKLLSQLEKPYYTQIDNYVIFSNHPQTLKNMIDDYEQGNTLKHAPEYSTFAAEFDRKSTAFTYFDTPVLFTNLKAFVSGDTWESLQKNKAYLCAFPHVGVQLNPSDDLLYLDIKAQYRKQVEEYNVPRFNDTEFISLFQSPQTQPEIKSEVLWYQPKLIIHDLDQNKQEEHYPNGQIRYELGLKGGIKHGHYKAYDSSGVMLIKGRYKNDLPDGSWKKYDADGELIEEKLFDEGVELTEKE